MSEAHDCTTNFRYMRVNISAHQLVRNSSVWHYEVFYT